MDTDKVYQEVMAIAEELVPYIQDTTAIFHELQKQGKSCLFEGAQGVMLDIDHGTYPFVTSSNTVCSNASVGAGVPAEYIKEHIAIVKAYTTRVGTGPFPTELLMKPAGICSKKAGNSGRRQAEPAAAAGLMPACFANVTEFASRQLLL